MKLRSISIKVNLILLSYLTINQVLAAPETNTINQTKSISQIHNKDSKQLEEKQKYRGVYYGVLPCEDCVGTMVTLSLKNKNNYLRVKQKAGYSTREYFEKGKYIWDEENKIVTLTSRKNSKIRKYKINDDNTLTELSAEGLLIKATQKNTSYVLHQKEMEEKKPLMHIR